MEILAFTLGVLAIAVGIILSIALHEIGHLVPAKLFGVRVTQYMVGFGKTLFSIRRGETEYGVKAIPLGGYVAMIGMYPPQAPGEKPKTSSTGVFQQMSQQAREISAAEIRPGDENRLFVQLPVWKRIIIMLGGPAMNLLIAVVLTGILITSFGVNTATTTVSEVYRCVQAVQVAATQDEIAECDDNDPDGPAYAAGLQPGDTITSFNGVAVESWDELTGLIRQRAGGSTPMTYEREGQQHDTEITPVLTERPVVDDLGRTETDESGDLVTHQVGFVGMGSQVERVQQPVTQTFPVIGQQLEATFRVIVVLPVRLWDTAQVLITDGERDPNGPMSVVGVGRIAGEAAAMDEIPLQDRVAMLVSLIAGVNIALMAFNLIPLLPLDGGHVVGALWDGGRKLWAKLRGRPRPPAFDISRLLPVTYVVAVALLGMGVLLIVADIFKPVTLN
ncbi:M50 family metallopeptidase [Auritidibacter ignavus]|uniref:M50 family metallopeptidase n=1 Tax=Auritidibacter ignavus TaxID=678932 RepID=UPI0024B87B11|nr:site-2 protease family protein [Auritidibacter ignavus]WHS34524.1 site-2 protease family protein [Auritidibacter ignavus]